MSSPWKGYPVPLWLVSLWYLCKSSGKEWPRFVSKFPFLRNFLLLVTNLIASRVHNTSVPSLPGGAADKLFIQLMRILNFQANCDGIFKGLHHFSNISPTPECFRHSGVLITKEELCPFLLLQRFCSTQEFCGYFVCLSAWGFSVLINMRGMGNPRGLN